MKLTGRKRLIANAAAARIGNAVRDNSKSVEEVDKTIGRVESDLAKVFDKSEIEEIMDDITSTIEASDALAVFDKDTIAAVMSTDTMQAKIAEAAQEAKDA